MSSKADDDDDLLGEYASLIRYPAMLGGTVVGQLVGIAIEAPFGLRSFWIPLVFSVIAEAIVAWRFGGKDGQPLDPAQCVRISATYSIVLLVVSLPLLVWLLASHAAAVPGGVGLSALTPQLVGVGLAALVAATVARAGLMMVLARKRP